MKASMLPFINRTPKSNNEIGGKKSENSLSYYIENIERAQSPIGSVSKMGLTRNESVVFKKECIFVRKPSRSFQDDLSPKKSISEF